MRLALGHYDKDWVFIRFPHWCPGVVGEASDAICAVQRWIWAPKLADLTDEQQESKLRPETERGQA